MVCLLTPTVAARWMADRPRLRRSVPRLVSISGIYVVILAGIRPGLALGPRACLVRVTLIFLQDMRSHQILSALAPLVALPSYCFAQAGKAELFGTIQDPQGLAATQAKVTSEGQATGARFDVLTDDRGEYHLLGLAAGQYVLTVEKPGFRPYRQEGIALRIGDQIRLDVKLELGQADRSEEHRVGKERR